MHAETPIPFALSSKARPIRYRLGDVAPPATTLVTCAGCGSIVARPAGAPLVCPLGCRCLQVS